MTARIFKTTARPRSSPWGTVDNAHEIAPGIWHVTTPGHGGFLISQERRDAMPVHLRDIPTFASGNAYEEDCDWSIVALAFPECFPSESVNAARKSVLYFDRDMRGHEIGNAYYEGLRSAAKVIREQVPQVIDQLEIEL